MKIRGSVALSRREPDINNVIIAGLIGGIVFGIMMQMMNIPTPEGGQMSTMTMAASSALRKYSRWLDLSFV